jgi:hypothetical protein
LLVGDRTSGQPAGDNYRASAQQVADPAGEARDDRYLWVTLRKLMRSGNAARLLGLAILLALAAASPP